MAHEVNCPHCGSPLRAISSRVRLPEIATTETLQREIEQLRATIARLRGTGFNPIRRATGTNPVAPR